VGSNDFELSFYLHAKVAVDLPCERLERTAIQIVSKEANGGMEERSRTHLAKRYEVPYQPTSFREWKSVVILGTACKNRRMSNTDPKWNIRRECQLTVETTETSSIRRNPTSVKENMVRSSLKPVKYSSSSSAGTTVSMVSTDGSLDAAMISGVDEVGVAFSPSSSLDWRGIMAPELGSSVFSMLGTGYRYCCVRGN
jgi:hypothetical protein